MFVATDIGYSVRGAVVLPMNSEASSAMGAITTYTPRNFLANQILV